MEGKPPTPPSLSPNLSPRNSINSTDPRMGSAWAGMLGSPGRGSASPRGRSPLGTSRSGRLSPKEALAKAGGPAVEMEPLVEALGGEDVEKVREAAAAIRSSLKNNPENKARLLAAGGIDALVERLGADDVSTVEHCVTALLNMSLTEGVEPLITGAGGIEGIVGVLRRGASDTAKENAAAALFTLSGPPENKIKVQEAGALPALVDLLKTGSLRGKKDSALALFNLALEEQCVAELVAQGSVPVLVSLLGAAEADMPGMEDKVMAVIANLCKFAQGRQAVHGEGGIAAMVDVIDGGSARAQEDAAVSLHLMAVNSQASFQLILEEGAMPGLVKLSQSGTPRAKAKSKALLDLLRGYTSQNSGSIRLSSSFSQSMSERGAPTTGEMKERNFTGEIR